MTQSQATDPNEPSGTDPQDNNPAPSATQDPSAQASATNDDDEMVTIPKSQLRKLQSQRDSNFEELRKTSALTNDLVVKDAIRDTIATPDFKEKFPDVTFEDIYDANPTSDENILEIAEARQKSYERVKQNHVAKVQKAEAPTITAADRDQKFKELKKPSTNSRFQDGLRLLRTKVVK